MYNVHIHVKVLETRRFWKKQKSGCEGKILIYNKFYRFYQFSVGGVSALRFGLLAAAEH